MSIKIESTTDTEEHVAAALGDKNQSSDEQGVDENEAGSQEKLEEESVDDDQQEDSETSEDDSDDEELEEKDEGKKEAKGVQKRISKLTKQKNAYKQEVEYWKQQALKQAQNEQKAEAKKERPQLGTVKKPDPDKFETHEEYIDALTDWKLEAKLSSQREVEKQNQLKTEQQNQLDSHVERVREFAKTHDDFQELMEDVDDIEMSLTVQEVILGSENGPELMYELAKNREEYQRICTLSPIAAARALGRFESKFISKSSSEKKEIKTTKAPRPITPISKGSTKTNSKHPGEMNFREYEAWYEQNYG